MAADATKGQGDEEKKVELVTRDLLGGGVGDEKELRKQKLELWKQKLELLSRTSTSTEKIRSSPVDLNLPPPPPPSIASVCTLEKVKSALEREMVKPNPNPKPCQDPKPEGSRKRRTSEKAPIDGQDSSSVAVTGGAMTMTVCPGCLQYLLVPVADPRCPRCDLQVPVKRFKIGVSCSTRAANKC